MLICHRCQWTSVPNPRLKECDSIVILCQWKNNNGNVPFGTSKRQYLSQVILALEKQRMTKMLSSFWKNNRTKVLLHHIWTLLDECYLTFNETVCDQKKLKLSNIIASLRILIFDIEYGSPIWIDGTDKIHKRTNCFERLQLKVAYIKNTPQYLKVLKKEKILLLCDHLRLSIQEAKSLADRFSHSYYICQRYRDLVKLKQKVFLLVVAKNNWPSKYLRQLKKFKDLSVKVSNGIHVYHHFRRVHDHERILEDMGLR